MKNSVVAIVAACALAAFAANAATPKWISGDSAVLDKPAPVLVKDFTLEAKPTKAVFSVAVAGWCEEFIGILQDFVKRRPNDLVGYFCGDSHFDNELEWQGVNWTVFQGMSNAGRRFRPWGAREIDIRERDFSRFTHFDIVAIKPSIGEFKIFRVGQGGSACDRICLYRNIYR